jgi:hypothetical protein
MLNFDTWCPEGPKTGNLSYEIQVFTAVSIKILVLSDVTACNLVDADQCFRGICCSHLQCLSCPQDGDLSFLQKRWYLSTRLHGIPALKNLLL